MSVTGSSGASGAGRVDLTTPDAATTAPATTTTSTGAGATRTTTPTSGRASVGASVTRTTSGANVAVAVTLDGGAAVKADGTIVSTAANPQGGPLGVINQLVLTPSTGAGPLDKVTDKALLGKIADKLAATHAGLLGKAPDDATLLAWRQSRAATLSLMESAAMRAKALGDDALAKTLMDKLTTAIKAEPWRQVRDFAFESLIGRAEEKKLPAVSPSVKEAIYPSKPPYDKWLANNKVDIFLVCDNNGSSIQDNIDYYKELGFKHKANADGSHTLTKAPKAGKPGTELTIPALPKDGTEPALFDQMDNPKYDVIAYAGHAGHGQRIEHALEKGVKGLGTDKAIVLMQCWGHGNVESLERQFPDAAVVSTTEMTSDNYDWELMNRMIEGFENKATWDSMQKKTVADLKKFYPEDITNGELNAEGHYFFPTTRSTLVQKYDRDGDGTADQNDHIFNVIYPKRIDAAGGYDPIVQPVPTYALDGTNLNQAINQVSLVVRYDHLLPANQERTLPWNADKWKSAGFFEPAAGDNAAFKFKKTADGGCEVQLSTKFAHTGKQELSRMMGYEAGLWMASQAGLSGADKTALAIGMTQRVIEAQGSWVGGDGDLLTEPWAEEALFAKRYGLTGFTFGELNHLVGEPDDFKPEHMKIISDRVKTISGLAALAERQPTKVGNDIPITSEIKFLSESGWTSVKQESVAAAMRKLGVAGTVKSFSPSYLNQNQATNVTALVESNGKTQVVALGVDSEGVVRTAARLDLDMKRKIDDQAERWLSSNFASVPDARATYAHERAAGKTFPQALAAALAIAKQRAPAGTSRPSTYEFDNLNRAGLLSNTDLTEVQSAVRRAFP